MRGALSDQFYSRRHQANDLIYTYSPRADADVVLRSSLAYAHFLLVESDPCVVWADYSPAGRIARLCGERVAAIVDAEVVDVGGTVTWREIKNVKPHEISEQSKRENTRAHLLLLIQKDTAEGLADDFKILTEEEVYSNPMRIKNWNRVISWMAQAREFDLNKERRATLALIKKKRKIRFGEVLEIDQGRRAGLFGAALFAEVQKGVIKSDMERAPLSRHSLFYLREDEP